MLTTGSLIVSRSRTLSRNVWFSTLDSCSGYWQVSLKVSDCPKTAFVTKCARSRFTEMFAEKAKSLTEYTEKGNALIWNKECQEVFDELKNRLCSVPILGMPDFTRQFILDTDVNNFAIGAVLSQCIDGKERPIACASRTLTKAESLRRYCVTRTELLAVVQFCKDFKHYLYDKIFTARTDHESLCWLLIFKNPKGQLAR